MNVQIYNQCCSKPASWKNAVLSLQTVHEDNNRYNASCHILQPPPTNVFISHCSKIFAELLSWLPTPFFYKILHIEIPNNIPWGYLKLEYRIFYITQYPRMFPKCLSETYEILAGVNLDAGRRSIFYSNLANFVWMYTGQLALFWFFFWANNQSVDYRYNLNLLLVNYTCRQTIVAWGMYVFGLYFLPNTMPKTRTNGFSKYIQIGWTRNDGRSNYTLQLCLLIIYFKRRLAIIPTQANCKQNT